MSLFLTFFLLGQTPLSAPQEGPSISVHNSILVQINEKNVSVVDVMKKMDIAFHQQYPHLASSTEARYQFYEASWRRILKEIVQQELISTEATRREITVTDGETREEMERRFGPNIMRTLDQLNLPFDEAWEFVKSDLLYQRMTGYFIYMKAVQRLTPQDIRNAYRLYVKDHPAFREWHYQVVALPNATPEQAAQLCELLKNSGSSPQLSLLQETFPSTQISAEYRTPDSDLSASYQKTLSSMTPASYSEPMFSSGRARIFYLHEATDHSAPTFEEMESKLREVILQELLTEESNSYFAQLGKRFEFDLAQLDGESMNSLHPFSLEW